VSNVERKEMLSERGRARGEGGGAIRGSPHAVNDSLHKITPRLVSSHGIEDDSTEISFNTVL
jgi:hypothetical protein